ncbi:MAG TPA: acyltransferase family protein [Methanomicrobiales archaeon]|nr:acyltransferase family protein [Methanomicrobiales archaeon]
MATTPAPGTRIFFVDYLKAAIVTLVFVHHLAITYGASGSFYYTEPATDAVSTVVLTLFTNFNQAWFLGLLFLLSGYFTPRSYERKGPGRFFRDRLVRLGIPLAIFFFVLNPVTVYLVGSLLPAAAAAQHGFTQPLTLSWQFFLSHVGTGPLWFVELLLIFDLGYMAWRLLAGKTDADGAKERPFPSYAKITAFILVLAASAYLLRIVAPIGAIDLGLPSLFDLPQYLGFFIVGLAAGRGDWLVKMPSSAAKKVSGVALLASLTLLPLAILGTFDASLGWGSLLGNGTPSSALYALWDSIFAVGTSMAVVAYFRSHFNHGGRVWKWASQYFYAAYILQAPILVFVAVMLSPVHIESLLKFLLAAVIAVPLIWATAYLARKIPFADRIL